MRLGSNEGSDVRGREQPVHVVVDLLGGLTPSSNRYADRIVYVLCFAEKACTKCWMLYLSFTYYELEGYTNSTEAHSVGRISPGSLDVCFEVGKRTRVSKLFRNAFVIYTGKVGVHGYLEETDYQVGGHVGGPCMGFAGVSRERPRLSGE